MTVEKNGIIYEIIMREKVWVIRWLRDKLTVQYEIPKTVCASIEELEKFIRKEEMF